MDEHPAIPAILMWTEGVQGFDPSPTDHCSKTSESAMIFLFFEVFSQQDHQRLDPASGKHGLGTFPH
jgi:hypothetical protein